ncbi:DNA repair protein RAD52 homolog isoform X2 [Manduca sexta]|uniref:DNA repair protein RAD52 homolog isoform X2 n=1 Tax=Manduca sexta TaxID=7130 RepID=UPI00189017E3|nr:DNA repair protein RAD52 homolog isoform X2 [Manduca sexta]
MQRKPSYPVPNCSIKMPDCLPPDLMVGEDDNEQQQRRQHLINFGHSQWGFNNWSWSVTKQELDFVDFANGKYCAGVVAFVSIKLKNLDIHRENIGYATSTANTKGLAIYKSRKCAVTNALRETLLSFGGKVASDLLEILETARPDVPSVNGPGVSAPLVNASLVGAPLVSASLANSPLGNLPVNTPITLADQTENNQNIANRLEPKTSPVALCPRKEEVRPVAVPPMARAMPMPAALPPAPAPARVPPAHAPHPAAVPLRPNSNDPKTGMEGMSEEEARAERKRRQRLAQEEFKQRQLMKNAGLDEKHELSKGHSSIDKLLMDIQTQDIVIDETGPMADTGKRKSPTPNNGRTKRRSSIVNKLDIVGKH